MAEQVYDDGPVRIEVVANIGQYGNNAYLVSGPDRDRVTVIDVPEGFEAVLDALAGRTIERIIVTHSHFDHWLGFEVLRAATDAPVYAGAEEADLDVTRGALALHHDETVDIGGASARVIHTPGHTPGSICILVGAAVLTGDTLFPGGPGHSRTPEALQQLISSITSRLHALPDATMVLPGHGGGTTIGVAKAEYAVFAAKAHPSTLSGDVSWLES